MSEITREEIIKLVRNSENPVDISLLDLTISLNLHTLIPHGDTLTLINYAKEVINRNSIKTIADIGTGSGIIALSLAKEFPTKRIYATDISAEALELARENALKNGIENIVFLQNFDNQWLSELDGKQIDLIVSNPPFVGDEEFFTDEFIALYPEVILEPSQAIRSMDIDGTSPYLNMIDNSTNMNTKYFLFHCNKNNLQNLIRLIRQEHPHLLVEPLPDDKNQKRFLMVSRSHKSK